MRIKCQNVGEGLYEWANVTTADEADWHNVEKVARAVASMIGDASVSIEGSLFEDGADARALAFLTPGIPLEPISCIPWRIRPVVKEGRATIRLYIPRA